MELRDYQLLALEAVEAAWNAGSRAPLVVLPTGSGKTIVFAALTKRLVSRNARVLIVVHRRELMNQASEKLNLLGVRHGLIAPNEHYLGEPVAVGSVQTIIRRQDLYFDYLIIDEGHHAVAGQWKAALKQFSAARICGYSASPARLDGRGLNDVYDQLILGPSVRDLITLGHLVEPEVYAYPSADVMAGVPKRSGEYDLKGFGERAPRITGSAVEHYRRLSPGAPAICFCASVKHADQVAHEFTAAGFPFATIHGKMAARDRARVFNAYSSGQLMGLTSVDLISEGTDLPFATTAILLRPTTSTALYLQQVGRVLRPADGKTRAFVLDHVGNSLEHGMPTDDRAWTLDGLKRAVETRLPIRQCKSCFRVYESGVRCPWCNSIHTVAREVDVSVRDADLVKVTAVDVARFKTEKKKAYAAARSYAELLKLTQQFGDKPGYAYQLWHCRRTR